jgi:hypothetical protein
MFPDPDDPGLTILEGRDTDRAANPSVRHRRRALRVAGVLVPVLLLVAGVSLLAIGGRHHPPAAAPLPKHTFSLAAPPNAVGAPTTSRPGPSPPASPARPGPASGSPVNPPGAVNAGAGFGPDPTGPDRLQIPSLGTDAPIVDESAPGGDLVIPGDIHSVGRWVDGASLSDPNGTVVLAGHVNYTGIGNGALHNLYEIAAGAEIATVDSAGHRTYWSVVALQVRAKSDLPPSLSDPTGARRLEILTCGGPLLHINGSDGGYNTYADNVIVSAVPL